jgi:hypothetical protein
MAIRLKLDVELERLYGLPLAEFTRARNDLARELRRAGEREAAEEVSALPKPSISAWTVNQLARKERLQVRSLLTASEHLRDAQARLLGGGSADELQEAAGRQREVVRALLDSAKEVLRSAGHSATDATMERIRETLTAVAGDEEGMRLVREGRLSKDLDPTGFGPLALGTGAGRKPPARARSVPTAGKRASSQRERQRRAERARKSQIDNAKREVDELRAEVAEQNARARRAKGEALRAERAAETAKAAAEKVEAELERLTARLEAAKDALARARSA